MTLAVLQLGVLPTHSVTTVLQNVVIVLQCLVVFFKTQEFGSEPVKVFRQCTVFCRLYVVSPAGVLHKAEVVVLQGPQSLFHLPEISLETGGTLDRFVVDLF